MHQIATSTGETFRRDILFLGAIKFLLILAELFLKLLSLVVRQLLHPDIRLSHTHTAHVYTWTSRVNSN